MSYYTELDLTLAQNQAKDAKEISVYDALVDVPDELKREDYLVYIEPLDTYYRWDVQTLSWVIVINPSSGTILSASNVGTGEGVYKEEVSNDLRFKSLKGTTDQVTITNNTNDLTFSLPQSINTTSSPSFVNVTSSSAATLANHLLRKTEFDAHVNQITDAHDASAISSDGTGLTYALYNNVQDNLINIDSTLVNLQNFKLDKNQNLSDLNNITTARSNLDVYSTTQVDTAIQNVTMLPNTENIYLDFTTGNDLSGNGTIVKPYKTLQHAITLTTDNTKQYTLYLATGNYTGANINLQANVNIEGFGSSLNFNITIVANGVTYMQPRYNNISLQEIIFDLSPYSIALPSFNQCSVGKITKLDNGVGPFAIFLNDGLCADFSIVGSVVFNNIVFVGTGNVETNGRCIIQNSTMGTSLTMSSNSILILSDTTFTGSVTGTDLTSVVSIDGLSSGYGGTITTATKLFLENATALNYTPTTPANWAVIPTLVQEALDTLASVQNDKLDKNQNLSDVQSVPNSRQNLKLGDNLSIVNGDILVGDSVTQAFNRVQLLPTTDQTTVTTGAGTLQIGTVQDISTNSQPTFARSFSTLAPNTGDANCNKTYVDGLDATNVKSITSGNSNIQMFGTSANPIVTLQTTLTSLTSVTTGTITATSGTVSTAPSGNTDIVNKLYADKMNRNLLSNCNIQIHTFPASLKNPAVYSLSANESLTFNVNSAVNTSTNYLISLKGSAFPQKATHHQTTLKEICFGVKLTGSAWTGVSIDACRLGFCTETWFNQIENNITSQNSIIGPKWDISTTSGVKGYVTGFLNGSGYLNYNDAGNVVGIAGYTADSIGAQNDILIATFDIIANSIIGYWYRGGVGRATLFGGLPSGSFLNSNFTASNIQPIISIQRTGTNYDIQILSERDLNANGITFANRPSYFY